MNIMLLSLDIEWHCHSEARVLELHRISLADGTLRQSTIVFVSFQLSRGTRQPSNFRLKKSQRTYVHYLQPERHNPYN